MREQYKCHKCHKLIDENEGITTLEGLWVCDQETCRVLDDENEAHVIVTDELKQINHENVLAKLQTYLHVWDLVGIINENVTDEEERNALLDLLEGAELVIKQLEQARSQNHSMWTCGDCGFAFDASHTDEGTKGQYSCPACAEIELEKKLKQAQAENSHIKATLDKFEYSDSPTKEELFQAYKEIYKGKPVGFFIEQLETYIKDLIGELEQARSNNVTNSDT